MDEHNANPHDRFIYIRGTKREDKVGDPASQECVRRRGMDVIELLDLVDKGGPVVEVGAFQGARFSTVQIWPFPHI